MDGNVHKKFLCIHTFDYRYREHWYHVCSRSDSQSHYATNNKVGVLIVRQDENHVGFPRLAGEASGYCCCCTECVAARTCELKHGDVVPMRNRYLGNQWKERRWKGTRQLTTGQAVPSLDIYVDSIHVAHYRVRTGKSLCESRCASYQFIWPCDTSWRGLSKLEEACATLCSSWVCSWVMCSYQLIGTFGVSRPSHGLALMFYGWL